MVDCVLINSPDKISSTRLFEDAKAPLGLLHIAAYLRQNGAEVSIIDCHVNKYSEQDIVDLIFKLNPLLIGLNITTPNRLVVYTLVTKLKTSIPNCKVIIGGPHSTCLPLDAFAKSPVDGVVLGEGEETVLRILQNLPLFEALLIKYSLEALVPF